MNEKKAEEDTYSYRGWLVSDKFYKRVLTVWGYMIVSNLLTLAAIYIIYFIFGVIVLGVTGEYMWVE